MASQDDLLTAQKGFVTATNNVSQTNLQIRGISTAYGIAATTAVKTKAGRLAKVSVIVAGSGTGMAYDASTTTVTSAPIYVIPMTVGVVEVDMPFQSGLVIAPGSGQTVSVSFS